MELGGEFAFLHRRVAWCLVSAVALIVVLASPVISPIASNSRALNRDTEHRMQAMRQHTDDDPRPSRRMGTS